MMTSLLLSVGYWSFSTISLWGSLYDLRFSNFFYKYGWPCDGGINDHNGKLLVDFPLMSMKFLCHFFWLILLDIRVSTPSSLCSFTWKIFFNILVWDNAYIWCWWAFLLHIRQMDPIFASSLLVFIFKLVFEFIDNKGYQWLLFDNSYFFVVGGDDVFVNFGLCVCVSTLWIF